PMTATSSTAWAGPTTGSAATATRRRRWRTRSCSFPAIPRSTITTATPSGRSGASSTRSSSGITLLPSARKPTRSRRSNRSCRPRKVADSIRVFAPAKINLFLHVGEKRADGYHALQSLAVFADVGDELELHRSDALFLSIEGPFAAGLVAEADNLVLKAAR